MMTDMAARRDGPALGWRRRDVGSEALAGRRWVAGGRAATSPVGGWPVVVASYYGRRLHCTLSAMSRPRLC
jgi:hypothetical protein